MKNWNNYMPVIHLLFTFLLSVPTFNQQLVNRCYCRNNVYLCHSLSRHGNNARPPPAPRGGRLSLGGPWSTNPQTRDCCCVWSVFQVVPLSVLHWELLMFSRPSCSTQPGTLTLSLHGSFFLLMANLHQY